MMSPASDDDGSRSRWSAQRVDECFLEREQPPPPPSPPPSFSLYHIFHHICIRLTAFPSCSLTSTYQPTAIANFSCLNNAASHLPTVVQRALVPLKAAARLHITIQVEAQVLYLIHLRVLALRARTQQPRRVPRCHAHRPHHRRQWQQLLLRWLALHPPRASSEQGQPPRSRRLHAKAHYPRPHALRWQFMTGRSPPSQMVRGAFVAFNCTTAVAVALAGPFVLCCLRHASAHAAPPSPHPQYPQAHKTQRPALSSSRPPSFPFPAPALSLFLRQQPLHPLRRRRRCLGSPHLLPPALLPPPLSLHPLSFFQFSQRWLLQLQMNVCLQRSMRPAHRPQPTEMPAVWRSLAKAELPPVGRSAPPCLPLPIRPF